MGMRWCKVHQNIRTEKVSQRFNLFIQQMLIVCLVLGTKEAVVNKKGPCAHEAFILLEADRNRRSGGGEEMKEAGEEGGGGDGRKLDSCK